MAGKRLATFIASGVSAATLVALSATEVRAVLAHSRDLEARSLPRNDFEWNLWNPSRALLEGRDPYPDLRPIKLDGTYYALEVTTVYPPSAFLPVLPLAAFPEKAASTIFQSLLVLAAFLTLWLLGVRDWRCYALWGTSALVVFPTAIGNANVLVVLCAALVWRYRDTAWASAAALTAAVAMKLILAPLVLWFLLTRRYRAAFYTIVAAPVTILLAWGLIGFNGLREYPELLTLDRDHYQPFGTLVQGLARQIGFDSMQASLLGTEVAVLLLIAAWLLRRNDIAAFTFVLMAALTTAPIGWSFYLAVLVVPLAVVRPRFAAEWLFLAAFWFKWAHSPLAFGSAGLSLATLAVSAGLVFVLTLRALELERSSKRRDVAGRMTQRHGEEAPATT